MQQWDWHDVRRCPRSRAEEANIDQSKISILAPVGVAVLGLKVGDMIEWPLPNARLAKLRIMEVLYQPEAAGDFHL